jgi:hypothetical protein
MRRDLTRPATGLNRPARAKPAYSGAGFRRGGHHMTAFKAPMKDLNGGRFAAYIVNPTNNERR